MRFVFGKQDTTSLEWAQENCWLPTNGLGGSMSASAAFSATRCDQAILMAAGTAPNERVNLIHRLSEQLTVGERSSVLDAGQRVSAGRGFRHGGR